MKNASPGTPDLVAMSFKHGFHGRLFGSLSLTRSKAIHKVNPHFLRLSAPNSCFANPTDPR